METRRHIRQLVLAGAIGGLAALATGSPATAGGCSNNIHNGGPSSVQQYVEQLPTSCGSKPSGLGHHKTTLPKSLKQKIHKEAGKDAALIEKIATEEAYGAPQGDQQKATPKTKKSAKHPIRAKHTNKKLNKLLSDSEEHANPISAAGGVITDGSDSRLIALVIVMLGIAAVVLATAVHKRRLTR